MRFGKGLTGLVLGALVFAASASVMAQKVTKTTKGGGGSPHETVEYTIDGAKLTLVYGRPFIKGRALSRGRAGRPRPTAWAPTRRRC